MKRTKVLSLLMLMSVFAFSLMSFTKAALHRFVITHCYSYTGAYPVDDTRVITSTNYTDVGASLTCATPRQKYCGFCIDDDSQYWDATAGTPKWGDSGFQSLLKDGSPTETYNNTSLHGTDIGSHVRVYFKAN